MNLSRRTLLKMGASIPSLAVMSSLATLTNLSLIGSAQAASTYNANAYKAKTVKDALAALNAGGIESSDAISITAADIAENGAVVPVAVTTTIPGATNIAILVEKNPSSLAADFTIPAGTEGFVSTRVKMGQTSDVYAAVYANGKWYTTKKEIKVTLGGCGG